MGQEMPTANDWRHLSNGRVIPSRSYCDQPYIARTDDGAWVCVLTTGAGREGQHGQYVVTMRSTDQGQTWEEPVPLEPTDGPEASYAVMMKVPTGRLYCLYNHNTDNVREVPNVDGSPQRRVDSLGHYVFKYSDDHGRSWSTERYPIAIREFEIDRENVLGGEIRFFWNVGRPMVLEDAAYASLHKVGNFGPGFFVRTEGVLMRSENILTETDPSKVTWETLPDGEAGLRTPEGKKSVAEEHSYVCLSDGSFFCVYRTIEGHPGQAYSRDRGRTWTVPEFMTSRPGGRRIKHPRAANFVWRCENGNYLYWFHNHGGRFVGEMPGGNGPYEDRNPAWLCGGVEHDSPEGKVIHWSEPEILLYDDDTFIRMSYPDLVEEGGKYYVTETQKNLARVHEIEPGLLEGLWAQSENAQIATEGLILGAPDEGPVLPPGEIPMPSLPLFHQRDGTRADHGSRDLRAGFSLDLWLVLESLDAGQRIIDSRNSTGQGLVLETTDRGTVRLVLNDGRSESGWDCDPGVLSAGRLHHVGIVVDGGPKIMTFIVDGALCDGGDRRQFGWGRFSPLLRHANGSPTLRVAPEMEGEIRRLRIYDRALRTSEIVANYQAGRLPA